MEILVIFIVISIIDKVFKTKKDQKNIQEARKRRMEGDSSQQTQAKPQRSVQPQRPAQRASQGQKPMTLAAKIREEIEKGYKELENSMDPKKTLNTEKKPLEAKVLSPEKDKRFISDYDKPYETFDGEGTLMGKDYQGDRYISEYDTPYENSGVGRTLMGKSYQGDRYASEYDKPYETHGRKTGSQEGKTYKKREEDFYTRREKEIPILDKKSGISMKSQILTGIIYSEILGEAKSRKNMKRSI